MKTYFSVRVKYDQVQANGLTVKKNELYLIDAVSFIEAETRALVELTIQDQTGLKVTAMKIENIVEIFNQEDPDADKWYRVKVMFKTVDEYTDKEKKTSHVCLVKASTTEDAAKRLHEGFKGSMIDYEIHTITETKFVDVIFCENTN